MASLSVLLVFLVPLAATQFVPPEIFLQAGYPAGFRAFIPDFPGCQRFAFHGKINNPFIHRNELGSIFQEVQRPQNGFWIVQDYRLILTAGDIVHFWTSVVKDSVEYPKYNQTWTVPDPENAVDILSPIKPQSSTPEKTMQTIPGRADVTTPGPGTETSPTKGEPSLSSPDTTTVSSTTSTTQTSTESSPTSSAQSSPSVPSTTSNSEPTTTSVETSQTTTVSSTTTPTSTESSPTSRAQSSPSVPSTTSNSEPTTSPATSVETSQTTTVSSETTTTAKPTSTPTESSPTSSVESSSDPSTTTSNSESTTTNSTESSVETSPSTLSTTLSSTTQTPYLTTGPTETTVPTTTTAPTTLAKKPPSEKRETPKPDPKNTPPSDKTEELTTPSPPERPISSELSDEPPQYPFAGLFPPPMKPLMPSSGPGLEICLNPWNFEERIGESRTQKLERQVAKLQCQLALFQRGYNQLSDTVESELTDMKKLIYGMVSRMASLESLLRSSPFG